MKHVKELTIYKEGQKTKPKQNQQAKKTPKPKNTKQNNCSSVNNKLYGKKCPIIVCQSSTGD